MAAAGAGAGAAGRGAGGCGALAAGAEDPPAGLRKSSVTKMVLPESTVPTPPWVYSESRMLSRWVGLFMKAVYSAPTVGPIPTFSPTTCQLLT